MLSPESSAEPGQWHTERAEYLRGILDAISDPDIEEIVVMSSSQVGKTEALNNVVGYYIDQDASPMLMVLPTLVLGEAWSKDRLTPMLRDTPALNGKVADARQRDSNNTLLHKSFPGGHITIAGANSPASLSSRPIRVVLCDEVDRYPRSAGSEGDPVRLAKRRNETFANRKTVLTSTPTVKGASRIEAAFETSDKRYYHVPCSHCGYMQRLRWKQVIWSAGRPESAAYHCEDCGVAWTELERKAAIRWGKWIASAPFAGSAGFHISALYSPWSELAALVRDFLTAKDDPDELQVWTNTVLGEVWEEKGEGVSDSTLSDRLEAWGPQLPAEALMLTAGVDVQDDRLEIELVAWGIGEESWSHDYSVLFGDPSGRQLWADLDAYLNTVHVREDGVPLRIAAACIDSGGHYTQKVYDFCRPRFGRHVFAIKGMPGPGRAVWPKKASRNNKGRLPLFLIGVDTAKETIYARLRLTRAGPGYCHFPEGREPDYFAALTAEVMKARFSKGHRITEWHLKKGQRNEALDCRVYAYAAMIARNPRFELVAKRMAARAAAIEAEGPEPEAAPELEPGEMPDDATPENQENAVKIRRPLRRNRRGFVKNWG